MTRKYSAAFLLLALVATKITIGAEAQPNIVYIMLDEWGYYHQVHAHTYYPNYLLTCTTSFSF